MFPYYMQLLSAIFEVSTYLFCCIVNNPYFCSTIIKRRISMKLRTVIYTLLLTIKFNGSFKAEVEKKTMMEKFNL